MDRSTRIAYLDRLGCTARRPSVDALIELHRAHVEQVPYETTWIHAGVEVSVDPERSVERIAAGAGGGYCFQLNGALATLLTALGYEVTLHRGGVHASDPTAEDVDGALGNHLVLLVHGLASDEHPGGTWYVDAGLGDALHGPLPLRPGVYHQGRSVFALSDTADGRWQFTHDPAGSFAGMVFEPVAVESTAAFADRHLELSTSPDSPFVRTFTAQLRLADGPLVLRRTDVIEGAGGAGRSLHIDDRDEWFDVLATRFHLPLRELTDDQRQRLWLSASQPEVHR